MRKLSLTDPKLKSKHFQFLAQGVEVLSRFGWLTRLAGFGLALSLSASSHAQAISLRWAAVSFQANRIFTPTTKLSVFDQGGSQPHIIYLGAFLAPKPMSVGVAGGVFLELASTGSYGLEIETYKTLEPNFLPVAVANNGTNLGQPEMRILGRQNSSGLAKVQYFGGALGAPASGNLDFLYAGQKHNDVPLSIAPAPNCGYCCASIGGSSGQSLHILHTTADGPNPAEALIDTSIAPVTTAYGGSMILVGGTDRMAGLAGGARASAYSIKSNGSVASAFTKTAANSVANKVATTHSFLWAGFSDTCNVLIDNKVVHDSNKGTFVFSFTVTEYNGTGGLVWTTSPRPGTAFQVSVGSPRSVYTLATNVPGQLLTAIGMNGGIKWTKATNGTRISAENEQGVVLGDNMVDSTGHHHVHFSFLDLYGVTKYTQTYATNPSNDDYLFDLQWLNSNVYIMGQGTRADGAKAVFGAEYDQT